MQITFGGNFLSLSNSPGCPNVLGCCKVSVVHAQLACLHLGGDAVNLKPQLN